LFLLFFSTHEELQTLDVDDAFFSTPEDVAARALQPRGGLKFLRSFQKQAEDQAVNLPPNLDQLVHNATYPQSPAHLVWRYFYDLKGSTEDPFPGGVFQWARFRLNTTSLSPTQQIFSDSLHQHADTLTLATLRIFSSGLGQPHFHFNANEMGYVISGCGQVGIVLAGTSSSFNIGIGDVLFFPVGTQHYIKSVCDEDLFILLAYSTGDQLETLRLNSYFRSTADHILAQLFHKAQADLQENFPRAA
ncbi:LEGB protein, partial [Psilopogon haemacephalus]|nr:LEGB protein [Psilopogon haemacephalus]